MKSRTSWSRRTAARFPVTDASNRLIGVITDRDIVCRVVAKGKNPSAVTAGECMTEPVVVVNEDTTLEDVLAVMEENQIRRVPVVDRLGLLLRHHLAGRRRARARTKRRSASWCAKSRRTR